MHLKTFLFLFTVHCNWTGWSTCTTVRIKIYMGRRTFLLVLSITVTMAAKSCKEKCDFVCKKHEYCSCTQADGETLISCSATTTAKPTTSTSDKYGCNKKCLACEPTDHCDCTSKGVTCTAKCPSTCDIGAGKTQTCDEIIKATDYTCDTLTKRMNCKCNGYADDEWMQCRLVNERMNATSARE